MSPSRHQIRNRCRSLKQLLVAVLATTAGCSDAAPSDDGSAGSGGTGTATVTATATSTDNGAGGASTTGGAGGEAGGRDTDGSAFPSPYRSGSRLRARVLDGGDGAVAFQDFMDTDLDVTCAFALDAEQTERCLPDAAAVFFIDDQCTTPVHVATKGSCDPGSDIPYLTDYAGDRTTCPDRGATRIYTPTDERAHDEWPILWLGRAGRCTRYDDHGGMQFGTLCDVTEVDPATFVQGTTTLEPLEDGLSRRVTTADDGASVVRGGFDEERQLACGGAPDASSSSPYPCLSPHVATLGTTEFGQFFADADCEVIAAIDRQSSCQEDAPVLAVQPVTCDSAPLFYDVGDALEVTYAGDPDQCPEFAWEPPQLGYELGDFADLSAFPQLESATVGEGAVRARGLAVGDMWASADFSFRDGDEACTPLPFSSGETVCAPRWDFRNSEYFADDACTVPLYRLQADGCDIPAIVVTCPDGAARCDVVEAARPVGALHEDFIVHVVWNGECRTEQDAQGPFFRLGEPLEPAGLPQLIERVL